MLECTRMRSPTGRATVAGADRLIVLTLNRSVDFQPKLGEAPDWAGMAAACETGGECTIEVNCENGPTTFQVADGFVAIWCGTPPVLIARTPAANCTGAFKTADQLTNSPPALSVIPAGSSCALL